MGKSIKKIFKFFLSLIPGIATFFLILPLWKYEVLRELLWRGIVIYFIYGLTKIYYENPEFTTSGKLEGLDSRISHIESELWDYLEPTKDESMIKELEKEINTLESRISRLESEHGIDYNDEFLDMDNEEIHQ